MKRDLISLGVGVVLFASVASAATAAPSYREARAWLADYRQTVGQDALMALDPAKLRPHSLRWNDLAQRADKLFGDPLGKFGPCVSAATFARSAWQDVVSVALARETERAARGAGNAAFQSFNAGQHYAACYDLIETLDAAAKK
ncbi:hypothetical protein [Pseudacidovorax intermedius]|uniref:hypothetical protein n=1 Tax=Pseudacidovorax intermedius TaxID=433924 RepID=UPI0026F19E6E|nr:hypothetical protein [Pseudacidovorax intermedius]